MVESPTPYRHVPISDLFWTGRKNKGKDPLEKPQGRRGAPAAGAGENILLQAGAGGPRRWPVPWGLGRRDRAGWPPLSYLCRLFFRFLLWFREDLDIFRSLEETSSESAERQRQRLWVGAPSLSETPPVGPGPPAPLPPPALAEDFVAIAARTGPDAGRSLQRGPRAAPDPVPVWAARGDPPQPGKAPGRDWALALASLHQSRLLRLLLSRC